MSFSSGFANAFQQPGVNQNTNAYYPQQTYAAPAAQPQPVQGPGVGVSVGGGGGDSEALATIAASMAADQAARLVYQQWQMRTGDEQLAMAKAQQAWQQTFSETQQRWTQTYQTAGLTGTLEGQATLPRLQQEWQQRFSQEQAALQQQLAEAGLLGAYEGQQTQAAQQQQWAQRFAEQQAGQQGALSLLGLQSQLQGPRDVFRYHQLNANTPGGFRDMLAGLAGRYGFAGSGAQGTPGAATLGTRTQDLLSGGNLGAGAAAGGGAPSGPGAPSGYALPSPNQIDLRNWGAMSPSQQQTALGAYESQGYYGADVEEALRRAAPRYTGPATAGIGL